MPALVMFLLGIVTDAATGLGEKLKAAARMVSLGYENLVPEPIRRHLPGHTNPIEHADVSKQAAAHAVSATSDAASGGVHAWVWLTVVLVLAALYLRPAITGAITGAVTARLSRPSTRSTARTGGRGGRSEDA